MKDRSPAYRQPVLHFDTLRLVALREGDGIEETLGTDNERKMMVQQMFEVKNGLYQKPTSYY